MFRRGGDERGGEREERGGERERGEGGRIGRGNLTYRGKLLIKTIKRRKLN